MFDPTNKSVDLEIGGHTFTVFFTYNTFAAFQKCTGKFFPDWYFSVIQRTQEFAAKTVEIRKDMTPDQLMAAFSAKNITPFESMGIMPLDEMISLIWAGSYEMRNGEPYRAISAGEIGELLDFESHVAALPLILQAAAAAMPKRKAKPESEPSEETTIRPIDRVPPKKSKSGGAKFGPSDAEILASQIKR
jgi:hypothetical protein